MKALDEYRQKQSDRRKKAAHEDTPTLLNTQSWARTQQVIRTMSADDLLEYLWSNGYSATAEQIRYKVLEILQAQGEVPDAEPEGANEETIPTEPPSE